MSKLRKSRERGYLLLELVIAIVVVCISIMGCYSMVEAGRILSNQSQLQAASYQIARQELQYLKGLRWSNRTATTGASFVIPASEIASFPAASFAGSYSVQAYSPSKSKPLEQIVVRVTWTKPLAASTWPSSYVELDEIVSQEPGK